MKRWWLLDHCLERISELIEKVLRKSHFWNPGISWQSSIFLLRIILTCGFRRQLFGSPSLYVVSCPRPAKLWLADLTCPQLNCLSAFFPPYSAYCPKSLLFPHSAMIWWLLFLSTVMKTKPPKDLNQNVSVLEKEEISFRIRDIEISLRYVC